MKDGFQRRVGPRHKSVILDLWMAKLALIDDRILLLIMIMIMIVIIIIITMIIILMACASGTMSETWPVRREEVVQPQSRRSYEE